MKRWIIIQNVEFMESWKPPYAVKDKKSNMTLLFATEKKAYAHLDAYKTGVKRTDTLKDPETCDVMVIYLPDVPKPIKETWEDYEN